MRERARNLTVRLDDTELAKLHHLAEHDDLPIGAMIRRWLSERYTARFGDVVPPPAVTRFGDAITPRKVG